MASSFREWIIIKLLTLIERLHTGTEAYIITPNWLSQKSSSQIKNYALHVINKEYGKKKLYY